MNSLLHTPEGVRDIYNDECRQKNYLSDKLQRVLDIYGYNEIQTPMFEFFDIFNHERGTVSSKDMYKFIDRDGSTMVLRPDITPSIARAVAKYFMDEKIPLRFSYCGNTFINNSSLQGKMKETTQIGAELIGDASIDGDAEIIAIAINMLKAAGLENFQLDIGHVGFFKELVKEAGLDDDTVAELRQLIIAKNYFGVETLVGKLDLPDSVSGILSRLPVLFGSASVIEEAGSMTRNEGAHRILDHLKALFEQLSLYGLEKYVTIDLGMITDYEYYTGIIIQGYTYGTGDAIVKGGRYDRLISQFGKDAASVGFVIVVDELMLALSRQKIEIPAGEKGTMVLYWEGFLTQAVKAANSLRNINRRVSMIKYDPHVTMDEYKEYCQRYNIDCILYIHDEAALDKIDIEDGSVKVMPIPL